MYYLQSAIVPLFVIGVAIALVLLDIRSWRSAKAAQLTGPDRDFRWRRFRRRMQSSAMLALAGILMLVGELIVPNDYPTLYISVWAAVFLLILWIVLLALADAVSSLQRNHRLKQDLIVDRAMLQAKIYKQRQHEAPSDEAENPTAKKADGRSDDQLPFSET